MPVPSLDCFRPAGSISCGRPHEFQLPKLDAALPDAAFSPRNFVRTVGGSSEAQPMESAAVRLSMRTDNRSRKPEATGMSGTLPSPRRIAGALAVLMTLPPVALAALAERLIDRLDALAPDADLEPDDDGEADHDAEAPPDAEGPWWTPTKGPDGCGPVRLAGLA